MIEGGENSDDAEDSAQPDDEDPPDTPLMRELLERLEKLWDESLSMPDVTPGTTLFHYTNAEAFLGIVQDKTIRATDAAFTNDSLELSYGTDLVREVTRDRHLPIDLEHDGPGTVFVACFSQEDDDLGQWRAYTNDGLGYSIGFDIRPDRFSAPNGFEKPRLVKVVYDRREQEALVLGVANALEGVAQWLSTQPQTTEETAGGKSLLRFASRVAFGQHVGTFKHHSFKHEREWRLVVRPSGPIVPTPVFKSGRFGVSSYVPLSAKPFEFDGFQKPTPDEKGTLPISKVVVGPKIPKGIGRRAVWHLLMKSGYLFAGVDVTHSESSYR